MERSKRAELREALSSTGDNIAIPVQLASPQSAERRHKKYRCLAEKNRDKGKLEQARRCLEHALYISMNVKRSDHLQVAMDLEQLATILYMQGKHDASQALMERAKRIKENI